jgi:hypothetical protein
MVLQYPESATSSQLPQGWLIDFDYGGKKVNDAHGANENDIGNSVKINPTYPEGYMYDLADGFRKGVGGKCITYDDDWYALGRVIFNCHELHHTDTDIASWTNDFHIARSVLFAFPENFKKKYGSYAAFDGGPAQFLRGYLQLAAKHGFTLIPEERFESSLGIGNLSENKAQNDSKRATGSPPKKNTVKTVLS